MVGCVGAGGHEPRGPQEEHLHQVQGQLQPERQVQISYFIHPGMKKIFFVRAWVQRKVDLFLKKLGYSHLNG